MSCGVYCFTNKINGKKYVGCSCNIGARLRNHKSQAFTKDSNFYFHRALRKYGLENFSFEIIEELPKENIFEREMYWIEKLRTNNPNFGYNQTEGGDSGPVKVGEENGNSKLKLEDIVKIRTRQKNMEQRMYVYQDYSDRISLRGFLHIWWGTSWCHVMPEVIEFTKTEEYKAASIVVKESNKDRRKNIRLVQEQKKLGRDRLDVFYNFDHGYKSISGFNHAWYIKEND